MEIGFKKLHENASIPYKASELAGGWDIKPTEIIHKSESFVVCKLGFALDIPEGYKLTLVPRSSLTGTTWVLQNTPGLGDADYTGEYQLRFRAIPTGFEYSEGVNELTYDEFPYELGDRIGQVYLEKVIPMKFKVINVIKDTKRGDGGYGSTGPR